MANLQSETRSWMFTILTTITPPLEISVLPRLCAFVYAKKKNLTFVQESGFLPVLEVTENVSP